MRLFASVSLLALVVLASFVCEASNSKHTPPASPSTLRKSGSGSLTTPSGHGSPTPQIPSGNHGAGSGGQATASGPDLEFTTSDGQTVKTDSVTANSFVTIKHMLEDLGGDPGAPIPVSNIDKATLDQAIALVKALNGEAAQTQIQILTPLVKTKHDEWDKWQTYVKSPAFEESIKTVPPPKIPSDPAQPIQEPSVNNLNLLTSNSAEAIKTDPMLKAYQALYDIGKATIVNIPKPQLIALINGINYLDNGLALQVVARFIAESIGLKSPEEVLKEWAAPAGEGASSKVVPSSSGPNVPSGPMAGSNVPSGPGATNKKTKKSTPQVPSGPGGASKKTKKTPTKPTKVVNQ